MIASADVATTDNTSPVPILCFRLSLVGAPVTFEASKGMILLQRGTWMRTEMIEKTKKEPAGISNLRVTWRSMVDASRTVNESEELKAIDMVIPVDQSGSILMSDLSSSTCSIVQILHGFGGFDSLRNSSSPRGMKHALLRNLQRGIKSNKTLQNTILINLYKFEFEDCFYRRNLSVGERYNITDKHIC